MVKKKRTIGQAVKDTVDFIYDYLSPHPDGITMNARQLGKTESRVCTILVKRGVIEKTKKGGNGKGEYKYRWVASMPPTKVLYGSIADEIRDKNRGYEMNSKNKLKTNTDMEQIVAQEREQQNAGVVLDNPTIQNFSIEELWAEIKRRGVTIENNRLALHTVTYFD